MKRPRTPGAGITGAHNKSLAGDVVRSIEAGPDVQRRSRLALHLDREADALLFAGKHAQAEYLAHRAAALRQAVAA